MGDHWEANDFPKALRSSFMFIYTTPLLEDHEDITCGAIIYDLDRDNQRIENFDLWVEVSRAPDGTPFPVWD